MRYRSRFSSNSPAQKAGHVYYVRLKTNNGIFYKLGFTTSSTVESRLAWSGRGDEGLIDQVLLFAYHKDAYDIEQRLHRHFSRKRVFGKFGAFAFGPLRKNGQSELYADDILSLDSSCNPNQVQHALAEARRIVKASQVRDVFGEILVMGAGLFAMICILPFLLAVRLFELLSPAERSKRAKWAEEDSRRSIEIADTIRMLKSINTKSHRLPSSMLLS